MYEALFNSDWLKSTSVNNHNAIIANATHSDIQGDQKVLPTKILKFY